MGYQPMYFFWKKHGPGAAGRGTPRPVFADVGEAQVCAYADLWHPANGG